MTDDRLSCSPPADLRFIESSEFLLRNPEFRRFREMQQEMMIHILRSLAVPESLLRCRRDKE